MTVVQGKIYAEAWPLVCKEAVLQSTVLIMTFVSGLLRFEKSRSSLESESPKIKEGVGLKEGGQKN